MTVVVFRPQQHVNNGLLGRERQQHFKMRSLHKDEDIEAIDGSSDESSEDEAPKQKKTKVVKF